MLVVVDHCVEKLRSTGIKDHVPRSNVQFKKCSVVALILAFAVPAFGDDTAPYKDDYTLLNPTPDADMRVPKERAIAS